MFSIAARGSRKKEIKYSWFLLRFSNRRHKREIMVWRWINIGDKFSF